jgi:hypothetical protein
MEQPLKQKPSSAQAEANNAVVLLEVCLQSMIENMTRWQQLI